MSFERYIQEIQRRSPKEQKTIVLMATTAVFVPVVAVLFFLGAFSFKDMNGASTPDAINSLKEKVGPDLNNFSDDMKSLTASTSEMLDAFRSLASSTQQIANSATTSSTTQDDVLTDTATDTDLTSSTTANDTDILE